MSFIGCGQSVSAPFFIDAAHFVHRAYLGFVWCFTQIFIVSPSERKRFDVLGAVEAVTKEMITITNDSYITAISRPPVFAMVYEVPNCDQIAPM